MNARTRRAGGSGPDIAKVCALLGDAVRARMLFALLDGRELAASELASRASSSPQAASAHLAKLVDGSLLAVRSAGRQRLFRLASPAVATAIEAIAAIAPDARVTSLGEHTRMERLRRARSCYDHLAGRLGVDVADALAERRLIRTRDGSFEPTRKGESWFRERGVDLDGLRGAKRSLARACLDWTERRPHLAGALGAALLTCFVRDGWLVRNAGDRALAISAAGKAAFRRLLGVTVE